MRDRIKLNQMAQLTGVQRARRAAAEAALHAARLCEQEARSKEEAALERSAAAQRQWFEHIDRAGFSPEYSRSLSTILIDREQDAEAAAAKTRKAAESCRDRQAQWQEREAIVRLSEDTHRQFRRRVHRRREEDRLNEMTDRITFKWSVR